MAEQIVGAPVENNAEVDKAEEAEHLILADAVAGSSQLGRKDEQKRSSTVEAGADGGVQKMLCSYRVLAMVLLLMTCAAAVPATGILVSRALPQSSAEESSLHASDTPTDTARSKPPANVTVEMPSATLNMPSRFSNQTEDNNRQIQIKPPPGRSRPPANVTVEIPSTTLRMPSRFANQTENNKRQIQIKPLIDFGAASFDLSQLQIPVSTSILVLGGRTLLPFAFKKPRFAVFYMDLVEGQVVAEAWKAGWPGVIWDGNKGLPFPDFAFDFVVVGRNWCLGSCQDVRYADEWLRVLRPLGRLLLWSLDQTKYSMVSKHALVDNTSFGNLFIRAEHPVSGLPVCESCLHGYVNGNTSFRTGERCQPYLQDDYQSVDALARQSVFRANLPIEKSRIWYARVENVRYCNKGKPDFMVNASNREGYIGFLRKGRHVPSQPRMPQGVPSMNMLYPSARRILDAGAGTCDRQAWLTDANIMKDQLVFNHGFYDCSMARVCGERGIPIMNWDWLVPLPLCNGCRFDLIMQAGGMHHIAMHHIAQSAGTDPQSSISKVLKLWHSVLDCNGYMDLTDIDGKGAMSWNTIAQKWAEHNKYRILPHSSSRPGYAHFAAQRIC